MGKQHRMTVRQSVQHSHQDRIAAHNFYRPRLAAIKAEYEDTFPKIELFTIDEAFGGWNSAQQKHFSDGGVFDQIYK
jgi:ABC-type sulfate transport system substrate-binding protein